MSTPTKLLLELCDELEARAQIDERACQDGWGARSGFARLARLRAKAIKKLIERKFK